MIESRPATPVEIATAPYQNRHPATQHLLRWLVPNPYLEGIAANVSQAVWHLTEYMVHKLGDGPELSAGLRHLREAKDCFVIQALEDSCK